MKETVNEVGMRELVSSVAGNGKMSKLEAKKMVDLVIKSMKDLVNDEGRLSIKGFITIERIYKEECVKRNNFTGEDVVVPEHYNAKAKVSKSFISELNDQN